jgi:hypothetical protein
LWIPVGDRGGEILTTPVGQLGTLILGTPPAPGRGTEILGTPVSGQGSIIDAAGTGDAVADGTEEEPGPAGTDDATPLVSEKPNDAYFATQDEAEAAALQAHGVSDTSTVEVRTMYGKNPNLTGPNGEPWYQLDAINGDGDLVTIDNHANGHYFKDNNTYALPHYHGPDGSHYFYGQRIW